MTMKKVNLRKLWSCHHSSPARPGRKPSERAVRGAFGREVRQLENQKTQIESELQKCSLEYNSKPETDGAVRIAELVVELESVKRAINRIGRRKD